jgi:hypothetical protein
VLFGATTNNRLLRTQPDLIYESASWADVHHCNFSTALAVVDTMMYVTTTENLLWWIDLRGIKAP